MENQKFDVIIPVGNKDVNFVHRVVDHIFRCFHNVNMVYVISSLKLSSKLSKSLEKYSNNCTILDENDLIPGLNYNAIRNLLCNFSQELGVKTGWYFQQFLKLAFARSKYPNDYYLSWDADTLPLAKIDFFDNNNLLFNPKSEFHNAYFCTLKKLLGIGKVVEYSFISEHMLFSAKIVNEMLDEIERANVQGRTWFEKILFACDFNNSDLAFSEFETYGSFCHMRYPGLYRPRHLNTFREAGLICGRFISERKLRVLSFDIDIASFEMINSPMFPYNIPNLFYNMNEKFRKLRKISFREFMVKKFLRFKDNNSAVNEVSEEILFRLPPASIK